MKTIDQKPADGTGLREEEVIAYLRRHSDLLRRHPGLLAELDVPSEGPEGAVSLIERQVQELRERHRSSRRQLRELVETARHNERLAERLHRLAVAAIGFGDRAAAMAAIPGLVREIFDVDLVTLRMKDASGDADPQPDGAVDGKIFGSLYNKVLHGQSVCDDRLTGDALSYLFADAADRVASCALVPIGRENPLGVLVLASDRPDRFHADLGTVYLDRLGALLGAALARFDE